MNRVFNMPGGKPPAIKSTTLFLNNIYNNKKLLLVFIFFVSLFVSVLFLILFGRVGPAQHEVPGTDYLSFYEPVANNILQGKGITLEGELGLRYPPGYPIILAIIFGLSHLLGLSELGLIVVFNIIVAAGTTCFLFLLAESIFNKKIALIASLLWLSYPFNLWFIKNPNTEPPFMLLFFLALWVYLMGIRKRSFGLFLISGISIGLMSLIRPISIFLPIPLAILTFFLIKKLSLFQKTSLSFILIIAFLAAVSPWMIYVYLNTGKIIPLSTGGAPSIAAGLTMMVENVREDSLIILPNDVVSLIDRSRAINRDNVLSAFVFFSREMVGHPIAFLKLMAIKAARAWYATSEMWWEKKILLVQLLYLIPAIAGIATSFKKFKEKTAYLVFLLIIIFYFWLATIAALSILRYMVPVMGIIIIFSAVTLNMAAAKWIKFHQNEA